MTEPLTLAAILADLQRYLDEYDYDECVDPIGYLETLQVQLIAATTRGDTVELETALAHEAEVAAAEARGRAQGWAEAIAELRKARNLFAILFYADCANYLAELAPSTPEGDHG